MTEDNNKEFESVLDMVCKIRTYNKVNNFVPSHIGTYTYVRYCIPHVYTYLHAHINACIEDIS